MGSQDKGNAAAVGRELERVIPRLGLAGERVLVACSGGIDSTVLAHALAAHPATRPVLGHVHHGLRGAEADADAVSIRALAERLGVSCEQRRIDPAALREGGSSRDRPTIQEAARLLRYQALEEIRGACGARCIATAHHLNDQAETVLLRLFRGTGPDGLAGIPERSPDGRIVRPLLRVSRSEIEAYARTLGLSWREDTSNDSDTYARNRLRRHWLPGLAEDFNPRLLRAIADLAEAQARDSEWVAECVEAESSRRFAVEGEWLRIDAKDWATLPEAMSRRLARSALERCAAGRLTSRVHLERMQDFLCNARPGTRIELPGSLVLSRDAAGFRIGPLPTGAAGGNPGAC